MGYGVKFEEANWSMSAPVGMEGKVNTLSVMVGLDIETQTNCFVSCWELTPEEKEEFLRTGKLYLKVMGGQPPVNISPFLQPQSELIPYSTEQLMASTKKVKDE